MEELFYLRQMLQKDGFMWKLNMKDAGFLVPLHQSLKEFVRFLWSGSLYNVLCLCFGIDPAPWIIMKLLTVPISVLRRINIRVIIYRDDMRLMRQTIEEILMYKDTTIFLLQHLSFILNMVKSILNSVQEINEIFIATTKDKVDSGSMPRPVCERFCHSPGADKNDSCFSFNNHSCITGTIKLPLSKTDKCYKTQWNKKWNKNLLDLAKGICHDILKNRIIITAEYLPSCLNVEADWQSKNFRDSSEWKLLPQIFHETCQMKEAPEIVEKVLCLENRPIQSGYKCNATDLGKLIPLCISTFLNGQQSSKQSKTE